MDDKLATARDAMMELRRRVNMVYETMVKSLDGYAHLRLYAEAVRMQGGLDAVGTIRGMIDECMADKTFFRMAGIDVDAPKRTPPAQPAPKGPVWRKASEMPHQNYLPTLGKTHWYCSPIPVHKDGGVWKWFRNDERADVAFVLDVGDFHFQEAP